MKKTILSLLLASATMLSFAQAIWKSDKMHSQLKFDISHLGINTVSGEFREFEVIIVSAKKDFSDAKFELTAQAASINTGVDPRNTHLKSADFFDAEKFPTLSFQTTSIKKTGNNQYKLTGNLTMHGITKPVTMNLTYRGTTQHPMTKKEVVGFHLSGEIKRADFEIGPKFPAPMLGETVVINADGEFGHE